MTFVLCVPAAGSAAGGDGGHATLRLLEPSGAVILSLPLEDGAIWEVRWRHSVTGMMVRDRYSWRDGRLVLTDSFTPLLDAAGLGFTPGRGELEHEPGGGFRIANIDEAVPGDRLWIRIGSRHAPTVLAIGGRAFDLTRDHASQRVLLEVTP